MPEVWPQPVSYLIDRKAQNLRAHLIFVVPGALCGCLGSVLRRPGAGSGVARRPAIGYPKTYPKCKKPGRSRAFSSPRW